MSVGVCEAGMWSVMVRLAALGLFLCCSHCILSLVPEPCKQFHRCYKIIGVFWSGLRVFWHVSVAIFSSVEACPGICPCAGLVSWACSVHAVLLWLTVVL